MVSWVDQRECRELESSLVNMMLRMIAEGIEKQRVGQLTDR